MEGKRPLMISIQVAIPTSHQSCPTPRHKGILQMSLGTIVIQLPKRNHGEYFENLGMLTTLLSKKPSRDLGKMTSKPLIEVVGGER